MNLLLPDNIVKIAKNDFKIEKKIIEIAKIIAKKDKSSHEFNHLQRVYRFAAEILKKTKIKINRQNLTAVCFLHDIGLCLDDDGKKIFLGKGNPENHAQRGALYAEIILKAVGLPAGQIAEIKNAINFHNNFKGSDNYISAKDDLSLILQDADRLDAIGAIGLFRYFKYAQSHSIPDFNPDILFSEIKHGQKQNFSVIHNLTACAVDICKDLNFSASKKIAEGREKISNNFIQEYLKEFNNASAAGSSYFGAMALARIFRKVQSKIQAVEMIKSKIAGNENVALLVLEILNSLEKEIASENDFFGE